MSPLTVDYRNLLAIDEGEDGVDPERLAGDLGSRFRVAHERVERARRRGSMDFLDLPQPA